MKVNDGFIPSPELGEIEFVVGDGLGEPQTWDIYDEQKTRRRVRSIK